MDPRPPQTPWLSPYLTVKDAQRAVDFYQAAFGFDVRNSHEEQGVVQHAEIGYRGMLLFMLAPEGAWGSEARAPASGGFQAPQSFYVYVDDVDTLYARALSAGAKGLMAPEDAFWGDRCCMVEDIDGYRWNFARFMERPEGH